MTIFDLSSENWNFGKHVAATISLTAPNTKDAPDDIGGNLTKFLKYVILMCQHLEGLHHLADHYLPNDQRMTLKNHE